MDKIFIHDLRFEARIGVYEWERHLPQTIRVDLDIAAPSTKPFATGMLMASSVDPGYEIAYQRAGAKMQKLIERYMGGEAMKVCGQCASMKELAMAGAKIEQMQAAGTDLTVVSATDPKLIDRIHAHSDRTNSEMQKMATAEK